MKWIIPLLLLLSSFAAQAVQPTPIPSAKFYGAFGTNGWMTKIPVQVFPDPVTGHSIMWVKFSILDEDGVTVTLHCYRFDLSDHTFADKFGAWGEQNLGLFATLWNLSYPTADIGGMPWCTQ